MRPSPGRNRWLPVNLLDIEQCPEALTLIRMPRDTANLVTRSEAKPSNLDLRHVYILFRCQKVVESEESKAAICYLEDSLYLRAVFFISLVAIILFVSCFCMIDATRLICYMRMM